ncbi:MAG: ABC transporter ATP-binding protein [Verrucomicrobiales bacterium]|nr:ABC transporter ATP-binding protein [Verrucomicrobiales bacterium]
MAYIELNNVSIGFGSGTARAEVLEDVNLHIEKGEFVALLGYSGTGKSTIMSLIAGLVQPDRGEVIVNGKKVDGPSPDRGLVFQNYSLLPWLDVYDNVALAVNEVYGNDSSAEKDKRIREAVARVNLSPALKKKPGELSGGMRQRNAVARTLSMNPDVLLLDEPLSALDALTRSVIQDQILEIWKELDQTIVLVTNDVDEGLYMADRVIPISIGPPATLGAETRVDFDRPRDRQEILTDQKYQSLREDVIGFLLDQKAKERAEASSKSVMLPNIKPMDISRHKPAWYRGLKPKPKKALA